MVTLNLPVKEILGVPSNLTVTEYLLEHNEDTWVRKTDIADSIDYSRQRIHDALGSGNNPGPLVAFGIAEISDREAEMPRFKRKDSPPMEFLQNYEGYPLADFFETSATEKLTMWIIESATVDTSYSQAALIREADISYSAFKNNIDRYIDAAIIETTENGSRTEYQINENNDVIPAIIQLNELLYQHYSEDQSETDVDDSDKAVV